ncbi:MAG TPA: alpha/beta hydrolase [Jiangellales bacterium]|nr:alpha/beta hydrolase [Jiangellales bacterium]
MTSNAPDTTTRRGRTTGWNHDLLAAFHNAQRRLLDRYGVAAEPRFVDVPAIGGRAQVLVAGQGPPLVMVIGGSIPAALWAPLMARIPGRTLYAMDLPGFGLTDAVDHHPRTYQATATAFLAGVLDGLGLDRCQFVTNSMGSLWSLWLAQHQARVEAQVMIGCPAMFLGTSAPPPMRLASVPWLGQRLLTLRKPSPKQVEQVMAMVGENARGIDDIRDMLLACERLPTYVDSMLGMTRSVMSWTRVRREVVTGPDQLRAIQHPVQVIWGEDDPFGTVQAGRRIAELIPGGRFTAVPGGHAPWFHHADQIASITREFLAVPLRPA